jgi:hypothetical protein
MQVPRGRRDTIPEVCAGPGTAVLALSREETSSAGASAEENLPQAPGRHWPGVWQDALGRLPALCNTEWNQSVDPIYSLPLNRGCTTC